MTINSAVEHFGWKLLNVWKPTEKDKEAYDKIVDFVNNKHAKDLENNQLFAKLYVYVYGRFLNYYRATVFDEIPKKELHKLLDKPLNQIIEQFREELNESELYEIFKNKGIEVKHPVLKSQNQKQQEADTMTLEEIPNWDYKTVEDQLIKMINLALDEYA